MECKVWQKRYDWNSCCVLIETSWNVKIFNGSGSGSWSFVLIETSWNVKRSSLLRNLRSQASINRNIVECKERTGYRYPCWEHRINRNIVECKAQYYGYNGVAWCCINRNIVECKGRTGSNSRAGKGVLIETSWNVKVFLDIEDKCQENCINRNIVECKESFPEGDLIPISVLIETSWNVKKYIVIHNTDNYAVLIETSWNVKCECISFFYLIHSINRNIVEYKVLKVYTTYIRILRINRNIVECKAHKQHFTVYFCIVIIETLWNVKYVK